MSTSMPYFSSIRLKITRADFESSTMRARLRVIMEIRSRATARVRSRKDPWNPMNRQGSSGVFVPRVLVLFDPGQCGLHVGKFACRESLDAHARGLGFFAGEFGARDAVHPNQAAADLRGEFLLL